MTQANPRNIVEQVLTTQKTKDLWTSIYYPVIPFMPSHFPLEAVLPAVMYMFRWGHRRGMGKFVASFSEDGKKEISIEDVSRKLGSNSDWFEHFDSEVGQAILGDLLLTFSLENKKHSEGRTEQVQRVYPTHYFASWIDLPTSVAHLRSIPEMLVALLVEQDSGTHIETKESKTRTRSQFSAGSGLKDNALLSLFGDGVSIQGLASDLKSDRFDESQSVGIDQLLTIRVAQVCGESPQKLKSESGLIPNRRPLAAKATEYFTRDFSVFIQAYGKIIPRHSLLPMLESCLALGISNIYLSTAKLLLDWERSGEVEKLDQQPWPLFVDCSSGGDNDLRRLSEECFQDCLRMLDRLPVVLMCLRVLDQAASHDEDVSDEVKKAKAKVDGTELLDLLGAIQTGHHKHSSYLMRDLKKICSSLAEALESAEEGEAAIQILRNTQLDGALRIAEALVNLMNQREQFIKALDSMIMTDSPHGLAKKRPVFVTYSGRRKKADARSIVLTNTMLDFLVHRHLRKDKKGKALKALTLSEFILSLRRKYGLLVDQSPPGMSISGEMLLKNKDCLERRLRDLGVLQGVNDAESMKCLEPRFVEGNNNGA